MQPKKQLKVQYIGIFLEIDSFYWPKMHFQKRGPKNLGMGWVDPPPIIRAMPERKRFFSIDPFPHVVKLFVWQQNTETTRIPRLPSFRRTFFDKFSVKVKEKRTK